VSALLMATTFLRFSVASSPEWSQGIQNVLRKLSVDSNQPELWKRLGKLQLDAGEFAEARRIFCHGSECCPLDVELKHHVRVFETFHGSKNGDEQETNKDNIRITPKSLQLPQNAEFLSLDVPVQSIPEFIRDFPQGSSSGPRTRLIHASQHPIIPKTECQFLIESAIRKTNDIGWTKDRHVQAPTCDVPVFDLDSPTRCWIRNSFCNALFPLLSQVMSPELEIAPDEWRVQDCFIVRYDAAEDRPGFASLKPHQDESLVSLTIALNDMDVDYQDGGLFISCTQDVLNGPAGTVLCFAGGLTHGGYPVSKGTRWILTVFLYVDRNLSGKRPGYTLDLLP